MSKQLKSSFEQILKMGYVKNEHATTKKSVNGHENAIESIFAENSFTSISRDLYPKPNKKIIKDWAETGNASEIDLLFKAMPNGTYIPQLLGTQSFPDIFLKDFDGKYFSIECKSVKGTAPMWNDNIPTQYGIYVISSGKLNETTVCLGKDIISPEMTKLRNEITEKLKVVIKDYEQKMKVLDSHERGWYLTYRQQSFQYGKNQKMANYFSHKDRKKCEQNVLNFVECINTTNTINEKL
jgi:hypothetical protein